MCDPFALAAAYGVRIIRAPLGAWGSLTLRAEYDPNGPVIRLDPRHVAAADEARAVAHELYHHREAIGEIVRLKPRAAREAAADAYAAALLA